MALKHDKTLSSMLIALTITGLFLGGCAEPRKASSQDISDTSRAAAHAGGGHYTVVTFDKGSRALSESSREALRNLTVEASKTGRGVDEIEVLAWADREYPSEGHEASKDDISLADRRSDSIRDYLKNDLKTDGSVERHNMAKRPGAVAQLFKTDDYDLKNAFEKTGATPVSDDSKKAIIGSKASKAVVVVKYKD